MAANGRRNADSVLISGLAAGRTYASAAEIAGISERTARRRMSDPAFRSSVAEARAELLRTAIDSAAAAATEAVEVVAELMRSAESESVRLRAACSLLELVGDAASTPIQAAIRGHSPFSAEEVAVIVRRLTEVAVCHAHVDDVDALLDDLRKAAASLA
jgi:hypothetical protein